MPFFDRRQLLLAFSAGLGAGWAGLRSGTLRAATSGPTSGLKFGPARNFSFETLKGQAQALAAKPYAASPNPAADVIRGIDFDKVQKIHFRLEDALWRGEKAVTYPLGFFHLNKYSLDPVKIFALDPAGTQAREILYSSGYFDYGTSGLDPRALGPLGFSGFRALDGQDNPSDWLAFQGASYFRTIGEDDQYGASSRGLAVNTALPRPEEFPRFSQFWLAEQGETLTIYALLEGISVTGAYRFDCRRGKGVTMDVHCDLFFRAPIERLGIAPLTSMYWYGENQRDRAPDWRPEIHDNDGLSILTGKGERIWRPLVNPPVLQVNSFVDATPKGFGLMQRDRDFADYEDDSAFYNKRPGIWVEPRSDWGRGAVTLVEIPTSDEVHDNIVAFWKPEQPIKAGDTLSFDYKLYWQDAEPAYPAELARVVSTRIGRGGIPGAESWDPDLRKFALDFEGGALAAMAVRFDVMPVVTSSSGPASGAYATKLVGTDRWRALFDVKVSGKQPIDLRCYLKLGERTLSETWIYQYFT